MFHFFQYQFNTFISFTFAFRSCRNTLQLLQSIDTGPFTAHNHTPLNDCFCLLRTDDCFCYFYSWQWLLLFFLLLSNASVTPCQCKCQYQQSHCAPSLLTCHSHEPGRFRWMLKVQRGKCNVPDWIMWTFKNPVKNCVTETSPNARFNPKTPFQQAYNLILSWYSAQSCVSRTPGCPHYRPWTFGLREQKSKLTIFSSILRFFIILWFSKTQKSLESRTKRNQLFI